MPDDPKSRQEQWYALRKQRWGPSLDHDLPGIEIPIDAPPPSLDKMRAIFALIQRPDPKS